MKLHRWTRRVLLEEPVRIFFLMLIPAHLQECGHTALSDTLVVA